MLTLNINGKEVLVKSDPTTPLLWVLRCELGMTGTKFGCGIGVCGACTVHLDGAAQVSCQAVIADLGKRKITTIEGLEGAEAARSGPPGATSTWCNAAIARVRS